jgi:hypothetical protein
MLALIFNLLPYLAFLGVGIFWFLEVLFPSLRNPDFNRWEIEGGRGSSVTILGWKKVLTPPRVIAQGYMSTETACAVALIFGAIFISIGILGIRHASGFPEFLPDLFDRF